MKSHNLTDLPKPGSRGTTAASIADWLRRQILDRKLAPGSRLATRVYLEQTLGASSVTIQRAIDQLRGSGFLESRGAAGTFVAQRPPNLFRVGLVLPHAPAHAIGNSLFWRAIQAEGERLARQLHGFDLVTYHDVDVAQPETCRQLYQDISLGRLAGMILIHHPPDSFANTPLMTSARLARVATNQRKRADISTIHLRHYRDLAATVAHRHGAKRVAVLMLGESDDRATLQRLQQWRRAALAASLRMQEDQCIALAASSIGCARQIASLLLRQTPDRRPDTIVIADDHLVEPATAGIADVADIPAPLVIAHANEPAFPRAAIPVLWIGYDIGQMLRTAVTELERQLAGNRTSRHYELEARVTHARSTAGYGLEPTMRTTAPQAGVSS